MNENAMGNPTMALAPFSAARPGATPRTVLVRPGVGAAGHVVQRSDLTSHRVTVDHATLILVEEGTKRIRWSGGECTARTGDALSLQAGEVVDMTNTRGPSGTYRALWICWFPDLLTSSNTAGHRISPRMMRHPAPGAAFCASFARAFDSLDDVASLPATIATHRLHEVLLWLAERGFHFDAPTPISLAMRIRRLLSTDPSVDWSMERVANETATSVPTLRRKLVAEGVIFRDLVQDVRMSHALSLLENSDATVLDVALATGYASASRFSARFRTRFGYLPTDVRGQNRGRTGSTRTK